MVAGLTPGMIILIMVNGKLRLKKRAWMKTFIYVETEEKTKSSRGTI